MSDESPIPKKSDHIRLRAILERIASNSHGIDDEAWLFDPEAVAGVEKVDPEAPWNEKLTLLAKVFAVREWCWQFFQEAGIQLDELRRAAEEAHRRYGDWLPPLPKCVAPTGVERTREDDIMDFVMKTPIDENHTYATGHLMYMLQQVALIQERYEDKAAGYPVEPIRPTAKAECPFNVGLIVTTIQDGAENWRFRGHKVEGFDCKCAGLLAPTPKQG